MRPAGVPVTGPATLSVCAQHTPPEVLVALDDDGTAHLATDDLARIRSAEANHIGLCRRGPIHAIPVIVTP
ncbi:hypothetical protein [Mycobacterium phage Weirdo19]|uniref:Uncharacterized protein n=1 Tax=Mycobacterium phage Weirdo19 TaxID=2601610 RepID=A0A6M2YSX4_9CAUD|nr:hypothetical protein KDJ11_gp76 [Mycobacterium phage Weirdo19]QEA10844.1 hypothetical protein [Mycobacterium phage Weirdo19]